MVTSAKQHTNEESYISWHQRSELDKLADLPRELDDELTRLDQDFWVSSQKLKDIVERFRGELDEGLSKDGQNIPMNVSWVPSLPTGREKGTILTLDLGGTNLRLCKVVLHGDEAHGEEKSTLDQEQYKLPEELKTGDAESLWAFIAEKVETFVKDKGLDKEYSTANPMPFGFTFSYPATQERVDHAVLQTWTKGFDIKGVEGQDVAKQLRDKIEEKSLPVELVCVINDTVGAMIASAYNDPKTVIGAIFGTGCNAAYMASLSDVTKLDPSDERIAAMQDTNTSTEHQKMAINCEYGAFDNSHRVLPRTKYDRQIDADSPRPGEQAFEKLSAGLYLGEIFRLILVDLADRGLVFKDQDTKNLHESYALDTGFLSQIEEDESPGFSQTRDLFHAKLGLQPMDVEIELSRRLAELIAVRGARLCACGPAAICTKEGITAGHVAADGSVANKHPKFKRRWTKALGEVLDWKKEWGEDGDGARGPIKITSAEDGSGVGCAIIAAMEIARRNKTRGRGQ
ncbi:putative hexokinase Kxk [Cucurbitaria berberidis CBS 394.84]|uniref:Phosphotransferase n=1 Tax=Cucurbitaria berberidis CBS 394.84 TaxID=1168544 RepID=A0A9P4GEA8_9PLEO|nr:putative hexokinase Kxk [Cucurbitaria berberidis CBS 394.84]KAF1843884.1 putative hexokinase Kxk [Cucurbitaria berberidis CBS 394.84]